MLNDVVYKDNRIPPRGFTNQAFAEIQSPPVGYTYADGQYWDDTNYTLPTTAAYAEVRLFFQTISREFVEFLRDENQTNDWGTQVKAYDAAGNVSAASSQACATTK